MPTANSLATPGTMRELNEFSRVSYVEERAGQAVRLLRLDVLMLQECSENGYVLWDDFHSSLVDGFVQCLTRIGIDVGDDFWQRKPDERAVQFALQPEFLERDDDLDLGIIHVKRGQEIVATFVPTNR